MTREVYRYEFQPDVPMDEVEVSLVLAIVAAECLHGETQVRLDASHILDADRHAGVVDGGTDVGKDINRLLVGFLRREFGEDAFTVERVDSVCNREVQEVVT